MKKSLSLLAVIFCCIATLTAQVSLPLTEDFSGTTFPPTGWASLGSSSSNNWSRYEWKSYSAPASARATGYVSLGTFQYLTTPQLAISADTLYEVKFWMWRHSDSWNSTSTECLKVFSAPAVNDTTGGTLLGTIAPYYLNSPATSGEGWYQYSFTLPTGTTNGYIVFCFKGDDGSGCYIDDVLIRKVPTCPDITGTVTIGNVATTSFDVTISDNTVTAWQAGYRVSGTDTAYTWVSGTTSTITVTGLQSSTYYEIVARRDCGTEYGEPTIPVVENTQCGALTIDAAGFTENFDGLPSAEVGGCYLPQHNVGQYSTTYACIINNATNAYSGSNYFGVSYGTTSPSASSFNGAAGMYRQTHLEAGKFYEISAMAKRSDYGDNYAYDLNFAYSTSTTFDATTLTVVGSSYVNTTTYAKHVAYFSVPTTGDYYLGFNGAARGSNYVYLYIDDVTVRELTIVPPTGIVAVPTSNSVTFTFNNSNIAELYIDSIEADVTLGRTATVTNIQGNTCTVNGLSANTTYYYAMRTINGTDTSVFSATTAFTTLCAPDVVPFFEDFETQPGGGTRLDQCWAQTASSGSYRFASFIGTDYNYDEEGARGISLNYSDGSSYASSVSYDQTICRNFSLDSGKFYQFSVYTHRKADSYSDYSFNLEFVVGTTMENLAATAPAIQITKTQWQKVAGYITVPANGEYYVGLRSTTINSSYFAIYDDIMLREVTAVPPTAYGVQNITPVSAEITFTTTAPMVEVVVDTVEANVTMGRIYHNAAITTSPVAITSLTPNTTYYYAIRTISGSDTSDWTTTGTFATPCYPIATLPFLDDFENEPVGKIGGCYTLTSTTNYVLNVMTETMESGCNYTQGGTKGICSASNASSTYCGSSNGRFTLTRDFSLESGKIYEVAVYAKQYSPSYETSSTYDYYLGFMLDTVEVASYLIDNKTWAQKRTYITVPADGTYALGMTTYPDGTYYRYTYLDNFSVREVTCAAPDASVIALKDTTATISLTTGTAEYELVLDTMPIDFDDMTAAMYLDTLTLTNGEFTTTMLTPNTTYYFAARKICGAADMSDWSSELSFTTVCGAHGVPYTDDFESYTHATLMSACYNQFSSDKRQHLYAYENDNNTYNNTTGGSMGLITYDPNDEYIIPAVYSATLGFADFINVEQDKAYEVSIYAKKMNADYDLTFAIGETPNYEDAVEIASYTVNNSEFQQYSALWTAESNASQFLFVYSKSTNTSRKIVLDDYAVRSFIHVDYGKDSICYEGSYSKYGFTYVENELEVGENTLVRTSNDTIYEVEVTRLAIPETVYENYTLQPGETYTWEGQTITAAGEYVAIRYTAMGCAYGAVLTVTEGTGIDNIAADAMTIVPNPMTIGSVSYIHADLDNVTNVEILNALGQVVATFVPTTNPVMIQGISNAGIYFVRLVSNDGTAKVQKLIVK